LSSCSEYCPLSEYHSSSGQTYAPASLARSFPANSINQRTPVIFDIQSLDRFGNVVDTRSDPWILQAILDGQVQASWLFTVTPMTGGLYEVGFGPESRGNYMIAASCYGLPLQNSPFPLDIHDCRLFPPRSPGCIRLADAPCSALLLWQILAIAFGVIGFLILALILFLIYRYKYKAYRRQQQYAAIRENGESRTDGTHRQAMF
jgi:hypothetical protein